MKRFLIPALFVVDVADYEGENEAVAIAAEMQVAANRAPAAHSAATYRRYCMLDEEIPNKQIPIHPEETEIPGTMNTCAYCGSGILNEEGDCQKCGL